MVVEMSPATRRSAVVLVIWLVLLWQTPGAKPADSGIVGTKVAHTFAFGFSEVLGFVRIQLR